MRKYSWLAAIIVVFAMLFAFAGCGGAGAGGGGSRPSGGGPSGNGPSGNGPSGNGPANAGSGETVNITFNPNGGTFTSDSSTANRIVPINKGAVVAIPAVTKDGYVFQNWNTAANGTGTALTPSLTHDDNTTYFAFWETAGGLGDNCDDCNKNPCECDDLTIIEDFTEGTPGTDGLGGVGNSFSYQSETGMGGIWSFTSGRDMSTNTLKDGSVFTDTGNAHGWVAYTASGNMNSMFDGTSANAILDFVAEAGASEGQALRFVFNMTASRYLKFGYNAYDVDLTDKTEIVVRLKSSVAGRFGIIVQSTGTAAAEARHWVRVQPEHVDTWREFHIPLNGFFNGNTTTPLTPSGVLETIAFLVAGQWNNPNIQSHNAGPNGSGVAYTGTLLIDFVGIK
jgi:hypothetical protein